MGTVTSCKCKPGADKSLESLDPPVAAVEEEPHPAPITIDLHEPAVDVNAPLDDRDIELVQQTFARVAMLGKEAVGWVLFMNIFEIAPAAKGLFPFKDDDLASSTRMKTHAAKVVATVATAVSLLRDLDTLVPVLHSLGLRHVGYSVIPAHYDVVGQALIKSLNTALGEKMTPAVTNAYLKVFTIVKNTMIEKCDYSKLAAPAEPEEAAPAAEPTAEAGEIAAAAAPEGGQTEAPATPKAAEAEAPAPQVNQNEAAPEQNAAEGQAQADDSKKIIPEGAPEDTHKKKKVDASSKPKAKKHASSTKDAAKKKKAEDPPAEKEPEKKAEEEAPKAAEPTPEEQLLTAAAAGDDKTIMKLLKGGVNVNFADSDGKTALHIAAEHGHEEVVGRLTAAKKIKVSAKTVSQKETPLHFAARGGHKDSAVMVARAGCELAAKNKSGKKAADLSKDSQLSQWLMSVEQNGNPGGTVPAWQGQKMR